MLKKYFYKTFVKKVGMFNDVNYRADFYISFLYCACKISGKCSRIEEQEKGENLYDR